MTCSELAAWVSAIGTVGCALVAIWGVIVASRQLGSLNTSLSMNLLSNVLQLEAEMNARKEKADAVAAEIRKESIAKNPNERLLVILGDELQGYLENWLNASDRLAFCILRGLFAERDWRAEYRHYFESLVRDHEKMFGPGTIYTNIVDLNDKWQRE